MGFHFPQGVSLDSPKKPHEASKRSKSTFLALKKSLPALHAEQAMDPSIDPGEKTRLLGDGSHRLLNRNFRQRQEFSFQGLTPGRVLSLAPRGRFWRVPVLGLI